ADRIHSWVSGRKNYDRIHSELVRMEGQQRNAETLLRGMQAEQRVGAVDPRAVSQLAYLLSQTRAVIQDMQVQMGAPGAAYRPSYSPYDRDVRGYDRDYDSRRVYRF